MQERGSSMGSSLSEQHYPRQLAIGPVAFHSSLEASSVQPSPTDVNRRFGMRLRQLRRARNMTQLRMAVRFGIDRTFISDVERGRKSISLRTLEILALGLNISLSDLLRDI